MAGRPGTEFWAAVWAPPIISGEEEADEDMPWDGPPAVSRGEHRV